MTTTPSHHSVVHQNNYLFAQGGGDKDESRISRAKVYKTMRNYHHTSDPGSQRKIITVFVFYIQGKITEC